jgi:hypothetical protein
MNQFCPISFKQIDERVAQLNVALAILSIIIFFFTPYKWIIWVLNIDFFMRGFLDSLYSFYSGVGKAILRIIKMKALMIDAGPKIFAAKTGLIFSLMIGLCYFIILKRTSLIIGSLFMFFFGA